MTNYATALLIVLAVSPGTFAQAPAAKTPVPQTPAPQTPAPQTPGPQTPGAQAPAPPRTASRPPANTTAAPSNLAVQVTDKSGNGIQGVAVAVSGPVERSGMTAADGSISFRSMRAGTYRLRFEHEKYITLEREVMMRGASEVSVALNPAPQKPVTAPPPPPPQTAAPPAADPRKLRPVEPRALAIPDWLDKNLIRSEPQKTTLIACTDGGAARILQVREPLNNQQNDTADLLLYVIASAGTVRVRDQSHNVDGGWFGLIPRGVPYSIARAGRNPVVAMTVAMGAPCTETTPMAR
jgi:mannose-6-phosphate isomerase-like protein (cupin superfamily)